MCDVVVFVNHTKKRIIIVEYDHLWFEMKSLFADWKDDTVETLRERDDFTKLKYLATHEKYTHDLGAVFS